MGSRTRPRSGTTSTRTAEVSEAYRQGLKVGAESPLLAGIKRNPYPEGTQEHSDWTLGFCKGYADNDL